MTQVINLRVIRDDGIGRVGTLIRLHRKASFEAVRGAHFRFVALLACGYASYRRVERRDGDGRSKK